MHADESDRNSPRLDENRVAPDDLVWLRRVAQRLATNADEADDLAQEAMIAAWEAASAQPRSKRAWLGGVLRNRARMLRRGEARRHRRDTMGPEISPSPEIDQEVHRRAVLTSMHDVLGELDAEERELLIARYCEDLRAPELAKRFKIPASTVRSRLSRATERVRHKLDSRWGERQAWAPAVAALPLPTRAAKSSPFGLTALVVAVMENKLVAALLAVVLGSAAWWAIDSLRSSSKPIGGEIASHAESPVDRAASERAEWGRRPDQVAATVTGTVLDAETGKPLAWAVVIVAPAEGRTGLRREPGASATVARSITNATGRFKLAKLPSAGIVVTAAARGYLPAHATGIEFHAGVQTDDVVLRLRRGGNTIDGFVVDIGGGPVEGAFVRAQAPGDVAIAVERAGYGAITDADGYYALTVPDGRWSIEAGGEDYTLQDHTINVYHGPGRVDFTLVPGAEIHGRVVVRETGKPMPGAVVGFSRVTRWGAGYSNDSSTPMESAISDAEGRFRLRPLPPAEYYLYATAPGHATSVEVVVHAAIGEEVTGVMMPLDPAFDVSGYVVDAGDVSHGIGGLSMRAMSLGAGPEWYSAVSDPEGRFEFHGLCAGTYLVSFDGAGIASSEKEHLTVEDSDRDDIRFEVQRGVSVRGIVDPIIHGVIRIEGRESNWSRVGNAAARVKEDGSFMIDNVPLGAWKIVASGDDGSVGEVEVDVPLDGLEDVVVPVEPRPRVSGTVVDGEGHPVVGVTVKLEQERHPTRPPTPFDRPFVTGTSVTAPDGTFTIIGVEPGLHKIAVTDSASQPVELLPGVTSSVTLEVGHDVLDLELRVVLPIGRIEGLVVDHDGQPVADAWVRIHPPGQSLLDELSPTISDSEGRFVFDGLAERAYDIDIRGPDANTRGRVDGVTTESEITVTLKPLGEARGIVTFRGQPVPRFTVVGDGSFGTRSIISPDGRFFFPRIEPGRMGFSVTGDDGATSIVVDIESGKTTDLELELGTWGSVEGTVVSVVDGRPLIGVELTVSSKSGQRKRRLFDSESLDRNQVTDDMGRFSRDGIGPGTGSVRFWVGDNIRGHEALGRHRFELKAGQHLDLGKIVVLAPADVPKAERGSLGLRTEVTRRRPEVEEHALPGDEPSGERRPWISWLEPGGPAARAGLEVGDLLLAVDGVTEDEVGADTVAAALSGIRLRARRIYGLRIGRGETVREFEIKAEPQRD